MKQPTEKEINIAAFRVAATNVVAVLLIIGLNMAFVFGAGYDARNWEWWLLVPPIALYVGVGAAAIGRKE